MSWYKKALSFLGSPTLKGLELYNPGKTQSFDDIYQSKDFPYVFLGGEEDLEKVRQRVGFVCRIIDVASRLPEYSVWDEKKAEEVKPIFDSIVKEVEAEILNKKCPIFVHCQMGMNRSAAVLASAISEITHRGVFDILREMKSQRGSIGPHDFYLYLSSMHSSKEDKTSAELLGT